MKFQTRPAAFLLAFACSGATAQYKCVDAKGNTSFQQTPCPASAKEQKVRVFSGEAQRQTTPRASPVPPQLSADQRILANIQRERRLEDRAQAIDNLERQINYIESVIDKRNIQLASEIAALQHKKTYAKNNLAGATWEQSISTEMQAVTQKYKAMNDVDFEKLKQTRSQLEAVKSAK
jgi:hypothetical protein